jgi:tripartite-type tricarboxylate transporter receptor subunit TctC
MTAAVRVGRGAADEDDGKAILGAAAEEQILAVACAALKHSLQAEGIARIAECLWRGREKNDRRSKMREPNRRGSTNPRGLSMGSGGNGSPSHLYGELFKMLAGVDLVHVPYRGGAPALTGLLGGQVHVIFGAVPKSIEYARAGQLRPLAVTTRTPGDALPGIPPLGNFLPGYEASGWQGIGAPKNTPAAIIDKLNNEINRALADPKIKTRIADLSGTPLAISPDEFAKFIADETQKWAKVVRAAKMRVQ